jgi:hypothetical protein
MPIDTKTLKQDPRSPRELVKAILDHQFCPRGGMPYSISFREQLLMDYQTANWQVAEHGTPLVLTLKGWEEGARPSRHEKCAFSHALQVLDAYRKETAHFRNDDVREAREAREEGSPHAEFLRRVAAESMESCKVKISNLNSIERLVRTLAHKLNVALIEPQRRK